MDVLITVLCAVVVLGLLVFIHEGGHYLASRAFGVRVTEFMLGLPGPNVGRVVGGTKFGVTPILLGGYARVCGMEPGEMSPHVSPALASLYRRGAANMEDVAADCGITDDEAYEALEELVEWGSAAGPLKTDEFNTYRAPQTYPSKKQRALGVRAYELGEPRDVPDERELYLSEYSQQYRALPFWKRSVILVAGVAVNLLFAMVAFVIIFSVIGYDVQNTATGEIAHMTVNPLQALYAGALYVGAVVQAVAGLFNPSTVAQTVSDSTSIVGIAVLSRDYFEAGAVYALQFMAMISVSLGIMNLLPIPPLDGGRFVIEVYQKITGKAVSAKAMNCMTLVGMGLFLLLFVVMLNQDIQRFVFGNW